MNGHTSDLRAVLRGFRHAFQAVGLFSLVTNVLLLTPTLYMLQVYDRVLVSRNELTLLAVSLVAVFLFLVMALADWMRSRVLVRTGLALDRQLSAQVFRASFQAWLAPGDGAPPRAFQDLLQIRQFLTGQGLLALFDLPWTAIYIGVLCVLHPWLGGAALLFAVVQLAWVRWAYRHGSALSEEASRHSAQGQSVLHSQLLGAEVVEAMGMLPQLQARWRAWRALDLQQQAQVQTLAHRVSAIGRFIRYSQQSLMLGVGALLVIDGQLSPGAMIAANVLASRALGPIESLNGVWRQLIGARQAWHRLDAMLQRTAPAPLTRPLSPPLSPALTPALTPPPMPTVQTTGAAAPLQGRLLLRGLSATAAGRSTPILQAIDWQIEPGTVHVILGPSGSGKSTLARCLLGLWPHCSGELLLDGKPLSEWNRAQLGPQLGYLPQDVGLLDGSIAENIARFGPVDSARVIEAAQHTGLHALILRFAQGYDTPVGLAGGLLSGGQRQRIGLARAVYGNPSLVVLDEPNANLDDAGEAALAQTVTRLKAQGKTVVLITHRPAILPLADQILVLEHGRVSLQGPRDDVLAAWRARHLAPTAALPASASA